MMDSLLWVMETHSSAETEALAGRFAPRLEPGDVLALSGDLGSGKTCFVRGVCGALGVADRVTSPSFLVVHEYRGRLPVFHLDFFRLEKVEDSRAEGYDEILFGPGVTLVEWSERVAEVLPEGRVDVEIRILGPDDRRFVFRPRGERGRRLLERVRSEA